MPELHGLVCNLVYTIFTLRAKIYIIYCTHFPVACMNYSYILLVFCAFIYVGVSVTRRVNVVIVNSRNVVFRIFNRQ